MRHIILLFVLSSLTLANTSFRHWGYRLFGCPGANEYYGACGNCELTCDTIGIYSPSLPANCTAGCYCKPGFARNLGGQCVHQKLCPNYRRVCPDHEVFLKCGPLCQLYCDERLCTTLNTAEPPQGCYCKEGFSRDIVTQMCIRKNGLKCYAQKKQVYQRLFHSQH